MDNETAERERDALFEAVLAELSGTVLVTTSTVDDVAGLVAALEASASEDVRLLVDEATAKAVGDSFLLASRLVDLIDDGSIEVRVSSPRTPFPTLLVGDDAVRSIAGISAAATTELRADADETFLETTRSSYGDHWDDAETFSARVPAYSKMLDALDERLGEEMRVDIEAVFDAETRVHGGEASIEPVRLALLLGAKNEVQFYELGLWGESEGVASRAKFSREKQALEENDLIDTEKVPTDVGRPRQRLVLSERLEGMDPLEIADTARSVLNG